VTFVGQRASFAGCALEDPAEGVEPAFVDLRPGVPADSLRSAVAATAPDAVVAFRPELVPAGAFDGLDAVVIGWLTEPVPPPGRLDGFDRILASGLLAATTAGEVLPVWRSIPLPVSDRVYAPADPRPQARPPRLLFVGRSTPYRERFLTPIKHDFDLLHVAHGMTGMQLLDAYAKADLAINLHDGPTPAFEHRVPMSLAAGLVVLSEPLSPRHGLVPGVDYLEASEPWTMWELAEAARRGPDPYRSVRISGRRAAERFRASRVYPALIRDAIEDVAALGSHRRSAQLA
jgi:hypothetical protein